MSEANWNRSREAVSIGAEQTILPGQLLGGKVVAADTTTAVTAAPGNTGNGVLTMADPAVSSRVKNGRYTIECVTAAVDGGSFRVEDPGGKEIGTATVGVAFNKEVKFTIADGATDFAVGDTITIDIGVESPADFEFVAFDPAGSDGSETVRGVALYGAATAVGESIKITAIVRDAEINGHCLALPDGITAAQTAQAYADLSNLDIIVRN